MTNDVLRHNVWQRGRITVYYIKNPSLLKDVLRTIVTWTKQIGPIYRAYRPNETLLSLTYAVVMLGMHQIISISNIVQNKKFS
jgi:hypothetical protein